MKLKVFPIIFFLSSLILLFFSSNIFSKRSDYIGKKIAKIEFRGNKNNSRDEIYDFITMREKKILSLKMLDLDIKSLYNTGFFENIKIQGVFLNKEEIKIIFHLEERPKVKNIEFIGSDEVYPTDVLDKLPLKAGEVITPKKVRESKEIIMKKYTDLGYFLVHIKVQLKEIKDRNLVTVRFIIDEGEDIPVAKINIYGNLNVNTDDILSVLNLKETNSLDDGNFKISDFEKDKEAIIAFLKSRGFLDAKIDESKTNWNIYWNNQFKKEKRVIVVNFKVNEGEKYFFNGYTLNHDYTPNPSNPKIPLFLNREKNTPKIPRDKWKPVYATSEIEEYFQFSNYDIGKPLDELSFFKDRAQVNELYSKEGYLFAQVITKRKVITLNEESFKEYEDCLNSQNSEIKKDCEKNYKNYNIAELKKLYKDKPNLHNKKFVHFDFLIRENYLAYIESIIIKGNQKTQDKIIRRELLIKPGDLFNSDLVRRSREKVFNLGYFKEVNLNMRPGSVSDKMNLIIDVVEQPTGTINLGGTIGSVSGFSVYTQLGENNLNGTGQKISGRVEIGPNKRYLELSWTNPWIYDKPWSLRLSSFYTTQKNIVAALAVASRGTLVETANYQRTGVGLNIELGHRFWINWSHFHAYSPSFYRSSKPSSLASDEIMAEERKGWAFRSSLTNGISYNSLDNVYIPTRGFVASASLTNVGQFLGGSSHFDRYTTGLSLYNTLFDYTFGGLVRSHKLKSWKVVHAFKAYNTFTFERSPAFGRYQDKTTDPYISASDRLFLGGFDSLRGWNYIDNNYPAEWNNGASHKLTVRNELRFPIEPTILWLFGFLDSGMLLEETKESYTATGLGTTLESYLTSDRYNIYNYWYSLYRNINQNPQNSWFQYYYGLAGRYAIDRISLNDPRRLDLNMRNIALDRFRYSWGIGLRIQIPVLPLRLYVAQKILYTNSNAHPFTTYETNKRFEFGFHIGDARL